MQNKKPRTWVPRLLTFEEAVRLEDMCQVKDDLLFAQHCFTRLSKRAYGVVYAGGMSRLHKDDAEFVDWCIFVAGAMHHRRCFTDGARTKLTRDDLLPVLTPQALATHDYLHAVADKHVAHSVNNLELGCTTLHIAIDGDGTLHRGGIGRQLSGIGPLSLEGMTKVVDLMSLLLEKVVSAKIGSLEASVQRAIDAMSDSEIVALREKYIPHFEKPRVDRRRNWPKRKRAT